MTGANVELAREDGERHGSSQANMKDPRQLQQLVQTAMDAILVRHDREEVRKHFHRNFVQHNPWAEDGGAHVEAMCDFEFGVEMSRWIVQGDLVAYHGLYTAPNPLGDHPLLCVDVWRVQGDQIVEHWDVLQPVPPDVAKAKLAGAGNGFADVAPDQVAANVATVRRLLEVGARTGQRSIAEEILAADFVQHGPEDKNRDHLIGWVESAKPQLDVIRTIASGDLVLTQLLGRMNDKEMVVYDIFRFNDHGKIAEQWNVMQDRLPLSEAANPHPHF